jgi:hypothetical protein
MAHPQNCHHRRRSRVCRIAIERISSISFRPSVGSLPIGSFLRQATTFMYLNETILPAETGITPTRPLLMPCSKSRHSVGDFTPSLPPKGAKLPYIEEYQNEQIGEELRRDHRAPKPIWASLKSNAPAVRVSG